MAPPVGTFVYIDFQPKFQNLSFRRALALSEDHPRLIRELQRIGVLRTGLSCGKCGKDMKLGASKHFALDGHCWRCRTCKKRASIRIGSYFVDAHLALGKCFMIIYCYMRYHNMLTTDMTRCYRNILGTSSKLQSRHSCIGEISYVRQFRTTFCNTLSYSEKAERYR